MPATDSATPSLSAEAWSHLEDAIHHFEDAWRAGQRPRIDELLAEVDETERRTSLLELVHIDLEFRLKAGEAARVEVYLAKYPELAGNAHVAWDLIRAEYRLRKALDAGVSLQEYARRSAVLGAGWRSR
jgi:hypothetical protein